LFFTLDIPETLAYYKEKLGFRCTEPPTLNPNKYEDELP